ncbi:STAS domain-containing protein [Couchioplanes caeruleus]|uniref:STAS domain-containing protein n=1 Tax=Couchioplanes caeruleus TaxID=56438 RepID=UPI0020BED225|nr:STAS domain-containing protein [Couchioplanes caeruleus]UQU64634.1 STAS domain-containing protein [Couchioplanes caeruleus]
MTEDRYRCTRQPPTSGGETVYFRLERPHPAGDRQTMHLTGDVDLAVADRLRFALTTTLTSAHPSELIVDLSAVTFLDCAGVTALLDGRRAAAENAKRYEVVNAAGCVHRVLRLTGALPHLTYAPAVIDRRLRTSTEQLSLSR